MAYATFDYYVSTFKGSSIPAADFDRLAQDASAFVDLITFDRAASVIDEAVIDKIAKATCSVAEEMHSQPTGNIASERVGQMSVSYVSQTNQERAIRKRDAARMYLASTGLMYGGLDED